MTHARQNQADPHPPAAGPRSTAATLISTLKEIEAALADLEQKEEQSIDYKSLGGQEAPAAFTQEEVEIMLLKMLLNIQEAAFILGVKPEEVHRLISAGEIPVFRIGRKIVRIPVKQLQEHIEAVRGGE